MPKYRRQPAKPTIEQIFKRDIEPLVRRLAGRCRHYDLPMLVSISFPVTEDGGAVFTQLQGNRANQAPTVFGMAKQVIDGAEAA